MSVSEKWLWTQIRGKRLGFSFKRQVPIGPYVMDFYCPEASLDIEVDGEQHDDFEAADRRRDQYLEQRGIATLRIPSLDLFDATRPECGQWPKRIIELCQSRTGRWAYEYDRYMQNKGFLGPPPSTTECKVPSENGGSPSPTPPSVSLRKTKGGAPD